MDTTMDEIKIPKDQKAQIVAIFTHLSYITAKLDSIEKGKAPMWAASAWKAVFFGVGTAVLAAVLSMVLIKPSEAESVIFSLIR